MPQRSSSLALCCTSLAALMLISSPAAGTELGSEGSPASVDVHAFASQGFILSSNNNYLSANTTHGSFQFSEVGINFTKNLTDKLRTGIQLFAQDLGPSGNYNARVDWFYLDYRFKDWFGLRAGRVKIPFGLYNETSDIDSARVPVLLPQSVYPVEDRNYLLAQTGGEVYGFLNLHDAGAAEYRMYTGTIFIDTATTLASPLQLLSFNVPFLAGGRLMWETPLDGLRLGGSLQTLRLDATVGGAAGQANVEIPATLWVGSVEYSAGDLVLSAEYSRWTIKIDSSDAAVFPEVPATTSERLYGMAWYRGAKHVQPGIYYSLLFPDVDHRKGRANAQNDIATTLRFDINDHWLFKLEAHFMHGTAGLDPTLNGNMPLSALNENWEVFLAKTTAYF